MKKFVLLSTLCFLICACAVKNEEFKKQATNENITFKEKYEDLNATKYSYKEKDYEYSSVEIDENNKMIELRYDEVLQFINNGTGILLFARPECPWCRLLVPTLIEYSIENDKNIYWYNAVTDRNANNLNYKYLIEEMYDVLPVDTYTQSENDPDFDKDKHGITQPMLFFIKDGEIYDYIYGFEHEYLKSGEKEKMYNLIETKDLSK